MPARAELAAAADVGHHQHAAARIPGRAHAARVPGLERDLEAAVAVQQRRVVAVGLRALGPDHEVGHARAVAALREELLGAHAAGVEAGGQGLERLAPVAAGAAEQQRIGGEEVGVAQQVLLGQRVVAALAVVQRDHAQIAGRGCVDRAAHEAPVALALPFLELADHVVVQVDEHVAARGRDAGQRARLGRLEQRLEAPLAAPEGGEVGGQQRAFGEYPLAGAVVAAQLEQQRVAGHAGAVQEADARVVGHVEAHQLLAFEQEGFLVVEVQRAHDQGALETGRVVDAGADPGVFGAAFEDRRRIGQRRAALPALQHARVARIGHGAGAEVGADDQRVGVDPGHVRLRLRQREAAVDEALGHGVELADHLGVGAAARQRDQAAAVVGPQALGAAPDPVLLLRRAQRVEIDHRLPLRLGPAVFGQRGAAPQAALVIGVLPEVVEPLAAARDHGDAVARVQHFEQAFARGRVVLARGDLFQRLGIALAHPGERLVALHVLQPEVGVVGGGGVGGHGEGGKGGGRCAQQPGGEGACSHRPRRQASSDCTSGCRRM